MKRIYMAIALIASFITGAHAQTPYIDLQAIVEGFESGTDDEYVLCGNAFIDTSVGVWGILNNGPDAVLVGDQIWLRMPMTSDTFGANTVSGYTMEAQRLAGEPVISFSNGSASLINHLMDIDKYENRDSTTTWEDLLVHKTKLVEGQVYGFYINVYGIATVGADNQLELEAEDTVRNNTTYKPIEWCSESSIKELLTGKQNEQLTTYPNPATNQINFKYNIQKTTEASVRVMDIAGRTVLTKDLGKAVQGIHTFNIDCSGLSVGTYILEFQTSDRRAISKFNVEKH